MDYRRLFFWIPLLASCSFARTQTIVELRADGRVVSEANNLRVEVLGGTGAVLFARDLNPQGNDFTGFPLLFPVSSRGDDSRTFELRAVATTQRRSVDGSVTTTPIAQNRVRTSFRRGQVLRFTLWLLSGCRCNVESERCEPDADGDLVPECVPIALDVNASDAAVVDSASFADDASVDGAVSETGPMCTAIQRLCGSQCVSRNSPVACGASCARCDSVRGGEPMCENDACSIRCGASTPDRCPNACVDFDSDRANCGACGRACAQGQLCVNRDCMAPPQCSMARDAACTGQTYCNLTTRMCAPGCDGRSGQCPLAQMCDTQTNACVCAAGTRTCGSSCVTCPSGANIAVVGCEGCPPPRPRASADQYPARHRRRCRDRARLSAA